MKHQSGHDFIGFLSELKHRDTSILYQHVKDCTRCQRQMQIVGLALMDMMEHAGT